MLTDTAVRAAKPRGSLYRVADSGGLCIEVSPSGAKLWRLRYRVAGRASMISFGRYPEISLAQARTLRDEAKALVAKGLNPAIERRAAIQEQAVRNAGTFQAVAKEWFDSKRDEWSPSYALQVETILRDDVYPIVGNLPVASLRVAHVKAALKPIQKRAAKTVAIRAHGIIYAVLGYAVRHELAAHNCAASLKGEIRPDRAKHAVALNQNDFSELLRRVDKYPNRMLSVAIQLLAHTACRTAELRLATWEEIDFKSCVWTIPEGHMKKRKQHIIPLSRQATELLKELKNLTGEGRLLIPNARDKEKPIANSTVNTVLRILGYGGKFSAHGLRSTFSTMCNEGLIADATTGRPVCFRPDVIEAALAHAEVNAVRRAYNHSSYLAERRILANVWSDYIENLMSDNVVPIGSQKRKRQ